MCSLYRREHYRTLSHRRLGHRAGDAAHMGCPTQLVQWQKTNRCPLWVVNGQIVPTAFIVVSDKAPKLECTVRNVSKNPARMGKVL